MIVEQIGNSTVIKAENNKCLIRKGEEQKIEDNDITIIYLAKSLIPDDFEEKDKLTEEEVNKLLEEADNTFEF